MKLKSVTSLPLLLAVSIAMLPSCDTPPEESIDQPGASAAETPTAGQLLLGSYRASLDPVSGAWDFQPLTREESGLTSAKYAVAGTPDGDEAVNVTSNFTLANCVDGVCGCSAGASDPPGWFGTTCANYSAVGFGKVTITNNTSSSVFVAPTAVMEPLSPSSLTFFSSFPVLPATCSASTQTRSVAPLNGNVYFRYNNISPSGCDKGTDFWISANTQAGQETDTQQFNIHLYVDSLTPQQVQNGTFESGTTNWTLTGTAAAISEHCSTVTPQYDCGLTAGNGMLPPSGSGNMLRLINNDSGSSNISRAVSDTLQLTSGTPTLSFRYKMGSFEANGCLSTRNDEFFVEVQDTSVGTWTLVPFDDPPDDSGDNDDRIGTGDSGNGTTSEDCGEFGAINANDVAENTWFPFSGATENDRLTNWATRTVDLTTISGIDADDLIQVRFTVQGGGTNTNAGNSVFLIDDVQLQ